MLQMDLFLYEFYGQRPCLWRVVSSPSHTKMINIYLWLTVTQERLVSLSIRTRETNIVDKLDVKQLICTIFKPNAGKLSCNAVLISSVYYSIILVKRLDF
jgi:hypothetical protein